MPGLALALLTASCPAEPWPVGASITSEVAITAVVSQWPVAKAARNDCGTRSVAFALALFGVVTSLADLEALLADRYPAPTGGRPGRATLWRSSNV